MNCCYGCKRQSTDKYPLFLNLVCGTNLIARKFGTTTTSQNVLLCFFCSAYFNCVSPHYQRHASFKHAWPVVFWFLLSDQNLQINFWQYIPLEMRCSWLHRPSMCNSAFKQRMDLISLPVFVDVTFRYHVFVHFKLDLSSTDMVQKINNEYFPCK